MLLLLLLLYIDSIPTDQPAYSRLGDGSREWSAEWMQKLNHKFGDDGAFWISFEDLLRKYQVFERTRLFDADWRITSEWTTLNVPWTLEYHDTYFELSVAHAGPVVVVLSQLNDRYFRGLEGQYSFRLAFRVHRRGEESYLVRTEAPMRMSRSVNVELDLEAGEYDVRVKIEARKWTSILPAEDVIRFNAKQRRDKLMQVGLAYDIAHSRGRVIESESEKAARKAYEKRKRERTMAARRKKFLKERKESHYIKTKDHERDRRKHVRDRTKKREKQELKRAKARKEEQEAAEQNAKLADDKANDRSDEKQAETRAESPKKKPESSSLSEAGQDHNVNNQDGVEVQLDELQAVKQNVVEIVVPTEPGPVTEKELEQPSPAQSTTITTTTTTTTTGKKVQIIALADDESTNTSPSLANLQPNTTKIATVAMPSPALTAPISPMSPKDHDTPMILQTWDMIQSTPQTPFTPATDVLSPDLDNQTEKDSAVSE